MTANNRRNVNRTLQIVITPALTYRVANDRNHSAVNQYLLTCMIHLGINAIGERIPFRRLELEAFMELEINWDRFYCGNTVWRAEHRENRARYWSYTRHRARTHGVNNMNDYWEVYVAPVVQMVQDVVIMDMDIDSNMIDSGNFTIHDIQDFTSFQDMEGYVNGGADIDGDVRVSLIIEDDEGNDILSDDYNGRYSLDRDNWEILEIIEI